MVDWKAQFGTGFHSCCVFMVSTTKPYPMAASHDTLPHSPARELFLASPLWGPQRLIGRVIIMSYYRLYTHQSLILNTFRIMNLCINSQPLWKETLPQTETTLVSGYKCKYLVGSLTTLHLGKQFIFGNKDSVFHLDPYSPIHRFLIRSNV